MEIYYATLELKKYHNLSSLRMQERHNEREYPMKHIDENLTPFNRELIPWAGLPHYTDRWKEILIQREAELGRKVPMRKNSVIDIDICTAFTPGAEKALNIDIDEWADRNVEFMKSTFGEKNILAMTLHCDEIDVVDDLGRRGVHIHTQIVPIDDRGRMCAKSFIGGRMMMKRLHDKYAEYMRSFGLSRGENGSKVKHEDRNRWYQNVTKLCSLKAPRKREDETFDAYMERLDKEFQDMHMRVESALEKAHRKIELSETRQRQIFSEYAYAVNLQHILEEEFGGDMRLVNQRLLSYQLLEKSVPRLSLQETITDILLRNPPDQSITMLRTAKKKKHAKWASLGDIDPIPVSTASDAKADEFEEAHTVPVEEEIPANRPRSASLLTEEGREAYSERRRQREEGRLAEREDKNGKTEEARTPSVPSDNDHEDRNAPLSNEFGEKLED